MAGFDPVGQGLMEEFQIMSTFIVSTHHMRCIRKTVEQSPCLFLSPTSENPINGLTSHEGPVAHVMGLQIPMFAATEQKCAHTATKEILIAPQQCPQLQIWA